LLNIQPYVYDANGNLTQDDKYSYIWDDDNNLIQINFLNIQPNTKPDTIQMTYDGMDRRVGITELHGTTVLTAKVFVWSGTHLCQERDATGNTITKQFFEYGEQINGTNYYYSKDHLGNVREMTDVNGILHANYDYDTYGRQTKLSGDMDSDFGYTGFYIEKTLCLDLTWYRAYDPEKGRWLSQDPLGESAGENLYAYVANDVLDWTDSLGECEDNPPFPPDFNPNTWKWGKWPNGKDTLTDPEGNIWTQHREDPNHWRHWDIQDKNKKDKGTWPKKSKKPKNPKKPRPKKGESPEDPSGNQPGYQNPNDNPSPNNFNIWIPPWNPGGGGGGGLPFELPSTDPELCPVF
jgi:RHS repeat-associated protein